MGRPHRAAEGGHVYHVLNRANARMTIFADNEDFAAFEKVLLQAVGRLNTRLLGYCLMPNHWHLVVWPRTDNELSRFLGWLTLTHTHIVIPQARGMCIKGASSHFRFNTTNTCMRWLATWNETPYERIWFGGRRTGRLEV
jgi:REP element-mobilizing transposase RayT